MLGSLGTASIVAVAATDASMSASLAAVTSMLLLLTKKAAGHIGPYAHNTDAPRQS